MTIELKVDLGRHSKGSIKLKRFSKRLLPEFLVAFRKVGVLLVRQIQANLSGAGRKDSPQSHPFPGKISGKLKQSVFFRVRGTSNLNSLGLKVAPKSVYAARQEFGYDGRQAVTLKMRAFLHSQGIHLRKSTTTIQQHTPSRPYVWPAWEKRFSKIMSIFEKAFGKALT